VRLRAFGRFSFKWLDRLLSLPSLGIEVLDF
jgi:hypothetical protein